MISQQFKFVGRGRNEKLKEFNARINYILRQMTRDNDKLPQSRAREGAVVNPPEATIVIGHDGGIDGAVIKFYAEITEEEPRLSEQEADNKPADEPAKVEEKKITKANKKS